MKKMKPIVRRRSDGTVSIVRDRYSNNKHSWFEIRKKVLERDGYRCAALIKDSKGNVCRCNSTNRLQVHHRKPLSKGGKTTALNLITLCERCHEARHTHMKRRVK